jgi:subtilase family serine protease
MTNMKPSYTRSILFISVFAIYSLSATSLFGQSSAVRITQPVDEAKLAMLAGNVHPDARAAFDRGAEPASMAMNHMLLVLKRSPQQQAALDTLLGQQQDRTSPNYHKWLTPAQYGEQFGAADQDVATIKSWLQSHGFQVNRVSAGETAIDFSGTAGQVQQAFHTAIHRYVLTSGEEHFANATNPEIPIALAQVVAGVKSLNNFFPRPMMHNAGTFHRTARNAKATPVGQTPQFTFAGACYGTNTNCYALGPGDFNKIYNVPSTETGAGVTIAIVSDSDVNQADLIHFRSLFGLPPATYTEVETDPSTDPGTVTCANGGDECEAALDVQWAGAAAPAAAIDLVVSATPLNGSSFGGDTSAQYVVDGNITPTPQILTYSYGLCELFLGTAQNTFYSNLWSQAASEGITVLVSSDDSGSAGCDGFDPSDPDPTQPALNGLAVNGVGSTPYNVAVGGTEFNYPNPLNPPTSFWTASNGAGEVSAVGYIPEMTYNDSCTDEVIYSTFLGFGSAEAACNNSTAQNDGVVVPSGGGGGASNCISSNGTTPSSCTGGYAKPSWQTGPGVPNDGVRDLPDISLFAGDGTVSGSFYVYCEQDMDTTTNTPCSLGADPSGDGSFDFQGVGGTSVSTQAFGGIVALIDQKLGGAQGNINPLLYATAGEESASSCNSSSPASTCVFNDITVGTISQPCQAEPAPATPNCVTTGSNAVGLLEANGVEAFNAGVGYDLATGLGSVNVTNLLNAGVGPNFYISSSNPSITVTAGSSGTVTLTVTAVGNYTGTINLTCSGLPSGATCSFSPTSVSLSPGTTSATVTLTVNTTASAMLIPTTWRVPTGRTQGLAPLWTLAGLMAVLAMLATFFLGGGNRRRGWRTALAAIAFAFLVTSFGCGGGGSSSSNSGGSGGSGGGTAESGNATVVGTDGSTGRAFSMSLFVTVNK